MRAIVYDAKRDAVSMLSRIATPRDLAILNPFDARSLAWDIANDVTDLTTARQLAETLIPHTKNESQPFFNNAARDLISGVIVALQKKAPGHWAFRDVLHVLSDEATLRSILLSTGETSHYVSEYFKPKATFQNIRSAIACQMAPFRAIAAAWHPAATEGRTFSLRNWMTSHRILILGEDESNRAALATVNRLLFTRATELLLNQPDRPPTRTWVFLDEVRDLDRLDALDRLLLKGRSKNVCVVLGFQDIEGLREVYGDKVANEIVGQCGHLAFLKLNSPTTAEWASQAIGDQEVLERIPSQRQLYVDEPPPTLSKQVKTRKVVLPSQLLNIEPPSGLDALTGYYLTSKYGLYRSTLTRRQIGHIARLHDETVADYVPTPASTQLLNPWSDVERECLGLQSGEQQSQISPANVNRPEPANPAGDSTPNQQCKPLDIPRMNFRQNRQNPE